MNTKTLIGYCSLLACVATLRTARAEEEIPEDKPAFHPWSITAEAGTTGVGGSLAWRFSDHFGVRGGADYFSYSQKDNEIEGVPYDTTFRPMSEVLTFNYYPFKKRAFYISVGAFFNQNQLTGTASDENAPITIDGITFPQGTVGTVHMKIQQQPLNPYLSIGGVFFYFDKGHHWSLGGELGVVYTGEPKVSLKRTGGIPSAPIDAAIEGEKGQLEDYAKPYKFWPVAKLAVNFSF